MGIVTDICRKITGLSLAQSKYLEHACSLLQLVSDMVHGQVTVFACCQYEQLLVIVAQAAPSTTCIKSKSSLIGSTVQAAEEPLVWRTMMSGNPIAGQREWALGLVADMQTYPLFDPSGAVIGVACYETGGMESVPKQNILLETANLLLIGGGDQNGDDPIYRRL